MIYSNKVINKSQCILIDLTNNIIQLSQFITSFYYILVKSSFHKKLYLVGHLKHQITSSKISSNDNCLRILFYNMRIVNLDFYKSATLVIVKCIILQRLEKEKERKLKSAKKSENRLQLTSSPLKFNY